ncbi:MAG: nucleotidyltransferase domain-containing protein [Phycisphaerales bacterium]|nr:nucleotidyltransferase domain-containing protein [Hyphomonadaceae bacterium]
MSGTLEQRASRCAQALAADADVRAVLLTGSVALGLAGPDSDVDLLVLHAAKGGEINAPQIESACFDGRRFDVETIQWRTAHQMLASAAGDLQFLRERGRLTSAIILFDRSGEFSKARTEARVACLDAAESKRFAKSIEFWADQAGAASASPFAVFCLQQLADLACVCVTSASSIGFVKPKWMLARLRQIGRGDLADLICHLHGCGTVSAEGAQDVLDTTREWLTPAIEACQSEEVKDYILRTFEDAGSLSKLQSYDAAVYVAHMSVRMMLAEQRDRVDSLANALPLLVSDDAAKDFDASARVQVVTQDLVSTVAATLRPHQL